MKSVVLSLVLVLVAGCVLIPEGSDSPEPAARIDAAATAAGRGDMGKIPELIVLLDSDDPATRLIGILALERLTGQTQGYDHAARLEERELAVVRWVEWYNENADALEAGVVRPGAGASTRVVEPSGLGRGDGSGDG